MNSNEFLFLDIYLETDSYEWGLRVGGVFGRIFHLLF